MLKGKTLNLKLEEYSNGILGTLTSIFPTITADSGGELRSMFFIDQANPDANLLGSYVLSAIESLHSAKAQVET